VSISHILIQPPNLVRAVLALDVVRVRFGVPAYLSDKGVPGALEH